MNTTPHHTACVAALLVGSATLTLCAHPVHACNRVQGPASSTLQALWPHDGATDVPVNTQLWYSASGGHSVRLVHNATGDDVPLEHVTTLSHANTSRAQLRALAPPLEPGASYTLHLIGDDTTIAQTFSTAQRGAETPPQPDITPPRVFREHFNKHTGDSCEPFRYNVVRFVAFDTSPADRPVLYTVTDDTHPTGAQFIADLTHPDTPHTLPSRVVLKRDEANPYDDPCITLRWIDPFGNTGTLNPICDPDACIEPDTDGIGWPTPDFNTFAREHCGDLPDDGVSQGSGSDESVGCTIHPSRRPSRLPTPILALAALLLAAQRLRRGRTTP